jgi:hypothetical protein
MKQGIYVVSYYNRTDEYDNGPLYAYRSERSAFKKLEQLKKDYSNKVYVSQIILED